MEKNLRAETIAGVRACLNSVKGKLELKDLANDYKKLMGCPIPFHKMGYSSLEEFLRNEQSLIVTGGPTGQIFIDAKGTEASAHITEMVAKQRPSKKKTIRLPPPNRNRNYVNYQAQAPNKWRPKNISNKWNTSFTNPLRQAAINHNQVVKINPVKQQAPAVGGPARISPDQHMKQINNNSNKNNNNHNFSQKDVFKISSEGFTKNRNFRDSSHENERNTHSAFTNGQKVPPKTPPPTSNRPPSLLQKRTQSIHNDIKENQKTDHRPAAEQKFHVSGDPVRDLHAFAKQRNLNEPIIKVITRQTKPHKPIFYDCQVKIDNSSFSSYPHDFKDEFSAKQYASKLALDALNHKFGTIKKRESLLLSNETDVLTRIPPLVMKHYHGIWSWQLEADYKDQYNELLPLNWLEVIDSSQTISVEAFGDKYVLRYCNPEDKGKMSSLPLSYEVSIPTSYVEFVDQGLLLVEVTCAVSTKEVWCRQIQTQEYEAFLAMNTQMESVYNKENGSLSATSVIIGNYYVAWIDNFWYRVRVLECDDNDNIQCLLVDTGDDQKVPKKHMFHLELQFAKRQAQAFICRLAGLEELYEVSVASETLQKLEGRTFQLEPCLEEGEHAKYDPIRVVMYDIESGVSINDELISLISIENAQPVLDEASPNEVFISYADVEGNIYLQIHSKGYGMLLKLIKDLESSFLEDRSLLSSAEATVTSKNSAGRLYFYKNPEDKQYCRIKILEWSPNGQLYAQIYYVDYGLTSVIKMSESKLYLLDDLSSVVSKFPEQALKVRLDLEKIPSDFIKIFDALVPRNIGVLLRCVGKDKDQIMRVKLFVRVANAGLVSVTESINIELHNREQSNQKLEKFEKIISLNMEVPKGVPSSGNLKSPPLPMIGKYYDIRVPTAVNPWNFFVQPHDSTESLNKLMTKLQIACKDIHYGSLRLEDVIPGKIYASKYGGDGKWYRTSVMKVIHHGSISVFYCDFGYYANLSLQQLVPLKPEFLKLPYQAIKAKLSGIKPKQAKWTMDDCNFFQNEVCSKSFVSVLTSVEKDELYRCDTILGLKLIDTSTEVDIYIEDQLIKKGIAVKI
ncbi:PREDICTED: tudor domain-containing protein 7B isoform X2 [Nicrophorus vespilloides]|uniref:Tudor domain-containing protein 7B isoform X2 n=1 Tax=Nicrophorus vespilloides TaxID=110193 RepID=A0ABM1N023_NICVS|nr:PREDICTED: tudor domain-containing protein 7B isoform X2 [Nicrophorus vespilloides]